MQRLVAPALLIVALAATIVADVSGTAGATSAPVTAAAQQSCSLPDCYAAIAFNPKTGAWGTTKNYPTRPLAKREAMQVCKSFDRRDRHCELVGSTRGELCLGSAMKVKAGKIVAHTRHWGRSYRASWRSAAAKLSGKERYRHKLAAICNG